MKKSCATLLQLFVISLLIFSVYSCSDDEIVVQIGPDPKTVYGTVTFVDANFIPGGVYLISAYPSSGWPPTGGPASYDTINVTSSTLSYNYTLVDLNPGDYVVSVGYRKITGGQSPIMSVYGCDTARFATGSTCFLNPPKKATIGANNEGIENINMLSWADTTKKVY